MSEIEREIRALPPTAAGLALKVYLSYAYNHSTDEEEKLDPPDGYIGDDDIAVIAAAAAALPELASYSAALLESEEAHGDG